MGSFWRYLLDNGMISKRKYNNLITDPDNISKYAQKGFINRQLVETSQVIKLTANILNGIYDKDTEIIEVPAKMNSQMRKMFDLVKVREVNDYHHAFDAYLTIFIGNYLYKCYPKLRPYFVYGKFKKFSDNEDIEVGEGRFNFLNRIERLKNVTDPETGEILWSNVAPNETIKQIKKVYDYKFMLTSHETYTKHGALFNQTIYSAKASKTMIPIKNDRPTKLYGGYSGNEDAYMSIIRLNDKKKTYKVVGISMRDASKLKAYENNAHEEYLKKLKEVIEQQFLDSGKKTKADFEIVIPKVNYHQRMQDGTKQFRIGSSKYVHNTKQLVLSEKTLKAIRNDKQYNGDAEKDLINAFDEILTIVNDSFSIFDIRSFRKKLNESRDKFVSLPVEDTKEKNKVIKGKRETLKQILIALHANGTSQDIPQLGLKSFGQMVKTGGLTLSENTVLIHQSPSGLFERKIKLSDL